MALTRSRTWPAGDKALSTIVDALGGSLWRLVIATRPLPASDLATLRKLTSEATLLPLR